MIGETFRSGSLTVIGFIVAFSLGFLTRWGGTPGPWTATDYAAAAAIGLGICFELVALVFMLSTRSKNPSMIVPRGFNYEEAEANAIGTEYVRADLLASADAVSIRASLRRYLDRRVAFYLSRDESQIDHINADTANLQAELWATTAHAAAAHGTFVAALAVSGMNDVLNSQGYAQAAWWNRIPVAAWTLMGLIAIACNFMIGYGERVSNSLVLLVLPLIVSVSFFLIADIDSPRGGVIRVLPQNLNSVAQSMKAQ
jgi:hypothetical protein